MRAVVCVRIPQAVTLKKRTTNVERQVPVAHHVIFIPYLFACID